MSNEISKILWSWTIGNAENARDTHASTFIKNIDRRNLSSSFNRAQEKRNGTSRAHTDTHTDTHWVQNIATQTKHEVSHGFVFFALQKIINAKTGQERRNWINNWTCKNKCTIWHWMKCHVFCCSHSCLFSPKVVTRELWVGSKIEHWEGERGMFSSQSTTFNRIMSQAQGNSVSTVRIPKTNRRWPPCKTYT